MTHEKTVLEGGCHCGAVRFRLHVTEHKAIACNCSICAKKGMLGIIVPPEQFELLCDEADLGLYTFNTGQAQHRFCKVCGIHPFSRPRSHPGAYDVNARCLDDGIGAFEIVPFDGQNWEANVKTIQ